MKKVFLTIGLIAVFSCYSFSQSQPGNIELRLSEKEVNGSNPSAISKFDIELRISSRSYTKLPAAEDFVLFLSAPKTDFSTTDVLKIVETNKAIYGKTGTMIMQEVIDPGGPNLYFPLVLNALAGMNLTTLKRDTWTFAFSISFKGNKKIADYSTLKPVSQINNLETDTINGARSSITSLMIGGINQLRKVNENERLIRGTEKLVLNRPRPFESCSLFPNPANKIVNVVTYVTKSDNINLSVMDMMGKIVKQQMADVGTGSNIIPIDIAQLTAGTYFIKVTGKWSEHVPVFLKFHKQ